MAIPAPGVMDRDDGLTPEVLAGLRRLLLGRHRIPPADADDVLAQALLDYVIVDPKQHSTQLLVVILDRRAHDFWRRAARRPLMIMAGSVPADESAPDVALLLRWVERFARGRPGADAARLRGFVRELSSGASFSDACRSAAIPLGSRARYRNVLRQCFRRLATRPLGRSA